MPQPTRLVKTRREKGVLLSLAVIWLGRTLALARLKPALRFVDDVNATAATDHAVVAMTLHERLERVFDLHLTEPL